jgi:hypothetical protein
MFLMHFELKSHYNYLNLFINNYTITITIEFFKNLLNSNY